MSRLSSNLTTRREQLGLKVVDVHRRLTEAGHQVEYSTVAGWFNGSRGVRNMEHLKALCGILQTDLNSLAGGEIEVSEDAIEVALVRGMRELPPEKKELLLALLQSMKAKG